MSESPDVVRAGAARQQDGTETRGARWWIGTVLGVVGLIGFAVLGIWLVIAVFLAHGMVDRLFPWPIVCLAVGVIGMVIAGAHRVRSSSEDDERIEGAAAS